MFAFEPQVEGFDPRKQERRFNIKDKWVGLILFMDGNHIFVVGPLAFARVDEDL